MFTGPVQDLIEEFARLPGIGSKSAQRVVFHLLKSADGDAARLADAITAMKAKVRLCATCFNVSDSETCEFCRDPKRDRSVICVVQDPPDIIAVERTREYGGLYHVLQGVISPIEGITPDDLRIRELLVRLRPPTDPEIPHVDEVIIATNPNTEGEATAMYLARLIAPAGINVTRLASGLPVGGDLEYADEITLGRALEGRHTITT